MEAPSPMLTVPVVLIVTVALAEPTDTSPPPEFADEDDALPIEVASIATSVAESAAPLPTLALTLGVEVVLVFAPLTRTTPPLVPLAAAVQMPSPEGPPASAPAPPAPSRRCVPLEVDVMSIAS